MHCLTSMMYWDFKNHAATHERFVNRAIISLLPVKEQVTTDIRGNACVPARNMEIFDK